MGVRQEVPRAYDVRQCRGRTRSASRAEIARDQTGTAECVRGQTGSAGGMREQGVPRAYEVRQ